MYKCIALTLNIAESKLYDLDNIVIVVQGLNAAMYSQALF